MSNITNNEETVSLPGRPMSVLDRITAANERAQANYLAIKNPPKPNPTMKELLSDDARTIDKLKSEGLWASAKEATSTGAHLLLVPQIIMGDVIEAEEASTIVSDFFTPINLDPKTNTVSIKYPILGTMRAGEVGEGGEYPVASLDVARASARQIEVRKIGIQINFTEEAISDSAWDIVGTYAKEAGRAMGRYKEYWAFREFLTYGHTAFDNSLADTSAWTSGRNQLGQPNDTLAFEDVMELFKCLFLNKSNLTHFLLHPLTWFAWQQTAIYGGMSYNDPGKDGFKHGLPWGFDLANQIPYTPQLVVAPELPFDYRTMRTDVYAIDASKIGINLIKEGISTMEFDDPLKDIKALKLRERYALAVVNEGRGIAVIRNVVSQPSWPYKIELTYDIT